MVSPALCASQVSLLSPQRNWLMPLRSTLEERGSQGHTESLINRRGESVVKLLSPNQSLTYGYVG